MSTVPARRSRRNKQTAATSVDHVSARVDPATTARLDTLAPLVTPLGTTPSRSIAVRACILTGLDALEALHGKVPR
jgi:hypothetical protein